MDQLEPCPRCQRHVRISETACPFCSASLAQAMAQVRARPLPSTRLSRAALFAFGVGAGVAAAGVEGCADDADLQAAAPDPTAGALALDLGSAAPAYGISILPPDRPAPSRDAAVDASIAADAGSDAGAVRPPSIDAGRDRDPREGTSFPLYGAPALRKGE